MDDIELALRLTPDDFCFTLSGNAFSEEAVARIQTTIKQIHKQRVTDQRLSEPGSQVFESADISQRRAAF